MNVFQLFPTVAIVIRIYTLNCVHIFNIFNQKQELTSIWGSHQFETHFTLNKN